MNSLTPTRWALAHQWTARLTVILGASLTFTLLVFERFFSAQPHFGLKHILAIVACATVMLAAAGWDAMRRPEVSAETFRFWAVAGYVALLVIAFRVYSVENPIFHDVIAPLALFGFIVNHYLPHSLRWPFFLLLSVVGILVVFGSISVSAALGLVAAGLALVGLCHLPIPMWARIALLLACAAILATVRLGWIYTGWAAVILPILASMFMFRLAIYLYDIANDKGPKHIWGRLSYFFMFPNLVFPFFPVVDYATFGRVHYNDEAIRIYHRGATFMLRGLVHLLLYRVVHTYLILTPDEVLGPGTFVQFVVSNFALYFRISGMFHIIAGLLLLFGFNLHETHARFYFSSSFIDFWRRINIYWKDFMQKMFFNPSYITFKRLGASHITSVVLSVVVVFVATWVLHAYQWFWLSGTMLLTLPDALFWAILAVLLVAQTYHEDRPRQPRGARNSILSPQALLVVRTVCTFLTICLLWSFWTSSTVGDWLALVSRSGLVPALAQPETAGGVQWLITGTIVAVVVVMIAITAGVSFGLGPSTSAALRRTKAEGAAPGFLGAVALGSVLVCGLIGLQVPAFNAFFGAPVSEFARSVGESSLNKADIAMLDRGYYEGLAGNRFNAELWEFFMARQLGPAKHEGAAALRSRSDYLSREFPASSVVSVAGKTLQINRWGMYDQDYDLEKPTSTYRIAVIGASRPMGWGVNYEDRFETRLERRFNAEHAGTKYQRYEILNFSVFGYHALERLLVFKENALRFQPDAVIYIAGLFDPRLNHHAQMIRQGVAMPFGFADAINRKAGVTSSMSEAEILRRLQPYRLEFLSSVYWHFGELFKQHKITAFFVHIPSISDNSTEMAEIKRLAAVSGFIILDLPQEYDPLVYRLSRWDGHPNEQGHGLIAKVLLERLKLLQAQGRVDMGLKKATDN
jgi:hypothetical protein